MVAAGGPVIGVWAQTAPKDVSNVWEWLGDSTQRQVSGSIPHNLWLTLEHALGGSILAIVIAVPLAAVLAHHRKAEVVSTWIVNLGRVIPTVTILAIAVVVSLRNGFGFAPWPIVFALMLLAIPPIFANTYTAVRGVPADAVGAARAMGFGEARILATVELPLALPLIMAGIRVAVTQVVATEALGALFGSDGLGNYIRYGFAEGSTGPGLYQIQAGALLVAGAALVTDITFNVLGRLVVPKGIRRAVPNRRRRGTPADPAAVDPSAAAA